VQVVPAPPKERGVALSGSLLLRLGRPLGFGPTVGQVPHDAIRYRQNYSRPPAPLGPKLLDRTRSGPREVLDIVLGDHTSL